MKSIEVDFSLVVYGNNEDGVPVLTDGDSEKFIKWYLDVLDLDLVHIELIRDSLYRISWASSLKISEDSLTDPDPYGASPLEINGCKCLVVGVKKESDLWAPDWEHTKN